MIHLLARCALLALLAAPASAQDARDADATPDVWFVRAGASGDGTSAESPLGSAAEIETVTRPGDVILVLPSDAPLWGGLALQPGQSLIGLAEGDRQPVVTNADTTRHGGVGIVLADGARVWNVRVEDTAASGILGRDVSAHLDGVEVVGANRGRRLAGIEYPSLAQHPIPQGGIVVSHTEGKGEVVVTGSTILDAAGVGVLSVTSGTARSRLSVRRTRVEGGARMDFWDMGVAAFVQDSAAHVRLDVFDSEVGGRLSRSGRNVVVRAAGGARAEGRVERSHLGPTGQDGVLATVMNSPSEVDLYIGDSVVEGAGQMNVEGTIHHLDPADPSRPNEGRVSIEIERSVIRDPGGTPEFESYALNVWLGPTLRREGHPPAAGTYELEVRESWFENTGIYGVVLGASTDWLPDGQSDPGRYDAVLRGNTIRSEGESDIEVYAAGARVDARENCWRRPEGLDPDRIRTPAPAVASQVDASDPIRCTDSDVVDPASAWRHTPGFEDH